MPKVFINPITKRKISFGGRVYKSLIKQGYTEAQLTRVGGVEAEPKIDEAKLLEDKLIEHNEKIIKIATNVVVEAFYQAKICQACLPSSLILGELLHRYGIDTQLMCGYILVNLDGKCAKRHVWLEYNGKIIDVGLMIFDKYVGEILTNMINRKISVALPDDGWYIEVDKTFEQTFEKIKKYGVEWYWGFAPYYLTKIRERLCRSDK